MQHIAETLALIVVLGLAAQWIGWRLRIPAIVLLALSNQVLEEAGLVAATALGLVMGNMGLPSIGEIRRFKENVTVLLVSGIFLLLTADLDPRIMLSLDWRSIALLAAVLFVVRPLVIWLATIGAGMSPQERIADLRPEPGTSGGRRYQPEGGPG